MIELHQWHNEQVAVPQISSSSPEFRTWPGLLLQCMGIRNTYVSCPCAPYEGTWASRGIAPLIKLDTIWRWLVKLHHPASLPVGRALLCYYRLGWPQSRSRKGKQLLNLPGIETQLLIKYKRKYTNLVLSLKDKVTNDCAYGGRGKDSGTCWHYMGMRRHSCCAPQCYRQSLRVGPHVELYRKFSAGNWTITALKPNIYMRWHALAKQLHSTRWNVVCTGYS
jgi:hypothetical protein